MDLYAEEEQPAVQEQEHGEYLWQHLWECSGACGEYSAEYLPEEPLGFDEPP